VQYRRVTDLDPTLTLSCSDTTLIVHPSAGARIGQIVVAGQPLLVDVPDAAERHPMTWGSYPMVPWAGRIRQGHFAFDGVEHQLAINHHDGPDVRQAHAIHGLAFDRGWQVDDLTDASCECSCALAWEFGGVVRQTIALSDDRAVVTLSLESTGADFPAEVGWHPWFRKPDALEFSPTAMYRRDEVGLPTGELIDPTAGPWDDCFVNTDPVVLRYDRQVASAVTVVSDCDHWVVFDQPTHATCVEPQSGPPDAFNLGAHVVAPATPLRRTMTISW
jgi:aldose 1-epimerase